MAKSKYKRLVDLFVTGVEYTFPDGTPAWLQVLNPFERDTVRKEAQIARARLVLAMREHGSDEQDRVKAAFYAEGRDAVVDGLAEAETTRNVGKIIDSVRNDPDWSERVEILDRGDEETAGQLTSEEERLLTSLQGEYLAEVGKRIESERGFAKERYASMDEESLWSEFLQSWLDRLGDEAAMVEYDLGRLSYGARVCEGVLNDGVWEHTACAGHTERIWESTAELRQLPEELTKGLVAKLGEVEFTDREAKNSDRQMSSSGSSPLPSEEEASTASTPTETPVAPPGSSSPPSPTPSPSSDGSNSPQKTNPPSTSG